MRSVQITCVLISPHHNHNPCAVSCSPPVPEQNVVEDQKANKVIEETATSTASNKAESGGMYCCT